MGPKAGPPVLQVGNSDTGPQGVIEFADNFGTAIQTINALGAVSYGFSGTNFGTAGQVLTSQGPGTNPTWQAGGGGGGIPEAPIDGNGYIRKDAAWTSTIDGGTY
jgi:hypothetical protein